MVPVNGITRTIGGREKGIRKITMTMLPYVAERYLYFVKRHQKRKYHALSEEAVQHYRALLTGDISKFCTPAWLNRVREAERIFIPRPRFSFLREKLIKDTMFVASRGGWLHEELDLLESQYSSRRLRELLIEEYVGMPSIVSVRYLTSHTSVHHLYHVAFYEHNCGISVKGVNSVVEWGGGYGNMAKIIRRMNPSLTYTIIDMPIFSCLQWLYLSTVLEPAEVNMIMDAAMQIMSGKINILPLNLLEQHHLQCELFIATWSLSESSLLAQDYISHHDFFGADRLLLAFQDSSEKFPDADRVGKVAVNRGARIEPINFLPGNYYAIC